MTPLIDRLSADYKVALDDLFANSIQRVFHFKANLTAMNHSENGKTSMKPTFILSSESYTRISLVTDGWSILRNQHLVNFVIVFRNSKT